MCHCDIDIENLKTQLLLLPAIVSREGYNIKTINISDILKFLQGLNSPNKILLNKIFALVKLLLVSPATNAESERMYFALKRLKTYLRSTMLDQILNDLMVFHVNKEARDD